MKSKLKSLQASSVLRYIAEGDCLWKHIWRHHLQPRVDNVLFYCKCDMELIKSVAELRAFYKQVHVIWSAISHRSATENVQDIEEQHTWNNRFIRIHQKRIFYKTLFGQELLV